MDTATLVEEQIDEGKHLLDQLNDVGFDVTIAFWVLTSEEALWFIYIASPVIDSEGPATAFRKVYAEAAKCQFRWISRSDIKLVGARNPIAVDAIEHQSPILPTRYVGRKLGSLIIEEAYIYPKRLA